MDQNPAAKGRPTAPALAEAIEVERLVKIYKTTPAVDDISFRIRRGSVTGLLGGNGAGKTTTIAMIMGLVLPTSGRIRVLGCSMPDQSAEVLGRMNFESPYVDMPMRLTVRQNLTVFGRLYAVEDLKERIAELTDDLLLLAGGKVRISSAQPSATHSVTTPCAAAALAIGSPIKIVVRRFADAKWLSPDRIAIASGSRSARRGRLTNPKGGGFVAPQ